MNFTGSRQVRRAKERRWDKDVKAIETGFKPKIFSAPGHVARSKYMPHIGKKEIGRYAV